MKLLAVFSAMAAGVAMAFPGADLGPLLAARQARVVPVVKTNVIVRVESCPWYNGPMGPWELDFVAMPGIYVYRHESDKWDQSFISVSFAGHEVFLEAGYWDPERRQGFNGLWGGGWDGTMPVTLQPFYGNLDPHPLEEEDKTRPPDFTSEGTITLDFK